MGMRAYEFLVPGEWSVASLQENLRSAFPLQEDAPLTIRRSYQDSFDWRLYQHDLLYFVDSTTDYARLTLYDAGSGRQLSLNTENGPLPVFARDIRPVALKRKMAPLLGDRALMERLFLHIRRSPLRYVNRELKTVLQLYLDEYRLELANGTTRMIGSRVCVETVKGFNRPVAPLLDYLTHELGLQPAGRSLLVEGLQGSGITPGGYSLQLPFVLNPDVRSDAAVKDILLFSLSLMEMNEQGVMDGIDPEFLHDFRIAVRRTRSMLSQVKELFPQRIVARFASGFHWLGSITSPARDMQVYLQKFEGYRQLLPVEMRTSLDPLYRFLQQRTEQEQQRLTKQLGSSRYRTLKAKWRDYLQAPAPERTSLSCAKQAIRQTADEVIWQAYRRVIKQGDAISPECADEKLHRLRIRCKKLRYLLEFFQSLYPRKKMKLLIRSLKQLQNILGDFNDFSVQMETIGQLQQQMRQEGLLTSDTERAMQMLAEQFGKQMQQQRLLFRKSYERFSHKRNRDLIMKLCKPSRTAS